MNATHSHRIRWMFGVISVLVILSIILSACQNAAAPQSDQGSLVMKAAVETLTAMPAQQEATSTKPPAATATISVSPELMLMAFGAAVVLGAVGSLYPAWRAAKTRPAEAMRYE